MASQVTLYSLVSRLYIHLIDGCVPLHLTGIWPSMLY